ncbi:MAG: hypothetical protein V4731_02320 [Pseudomonadota bacterium]
MYQPDCEPQIRYRVSRMNRVTAEEGARLAWRGLIAATCVVLTSSAALAQDRIYRCGNEYINNAKDAQARGCKVVEGGNITIVQGTAVQKAPVKVAAASPVTPRQDAKSDSPEQRARDSEARTILQAELVRSEARLAEQLKEYNNGEPEKQGIEGRNYQRYLDRVKELKDSIARTNSDIAGLKREIGRLPNSAVAQQ